MLLFRRASSVETTVIYWPRRLGAPWARTGRLGAKAGDLPTGQSQNCQTIMVLLKPWSGCLASLSSDNDHAVISTISIPAGAMH